MSDVTRDLIVAAVLFGPVFVVYFIWRGRNR